MEIIVEGKGRKFYKPDEVMVDLQFYNKNSSYELALKEGVKSIELFIKNVLEELNFSKEDLKTRSFRVYEENKYDYNEKIYVHDGFAYTQSANIKFDYNIEIMSKLMDMISKMKNPPKYTIVFNVKDEQSVKSEVLKEAYNKAKERAEAIAIAAGKTLKECVKTDFRPFEEYVNSNTRINQMDYEKSINMVDRASINTEQIITNTFTPEDIEISETLYCLWTTD